MNIIIEQEIELHQVWFNSNKPIVERLLHPDFKEVDESGRSHNFNEILSFMDHAKHSDDRVHAQDFELLNLSSDCIVLLYKSALLASNGEYRSFAKRSSIWVESDGLWKMKYHQGTHCEAFELSI